MVLETVRRLQVVFAVLSVLQFLNSVGAVSYTWVTEQESRYGDTFEQVKFT